MVLDLGFNFVVMAEEFVGIKEKHVGFQRPVLLLSSAYRFNARLKKKFFLLWLLTYSVLIFT
jgi:hypothetical protein